MATTRTRFTGTLSVLIPALVLVGCESATTEPAQQLSSEAASTVSAASAANTAGLVNDVRALTSQYHDKRTAIQAGYTEDPHCVEDPTLGGWGTTG
jgi:hypothetical protein